MISRKKGESGYSEEFFLWTVNLIPLRWRIRCFEWIAKILFALDGRHRRIAERNLAIAFPDRDPAERRAIALRVFKNLGRVAAEFFSIAGFREKNIQQYVCLEGLEHFRQAQQKGKGC